MLRVSPLLLCAPLVGQNVTLFNRLAAAREKYVLLTKGSAKEASLSWKLTTDNPQGKLLSWATNHALSIIMPSAVVTLQKFKHIEITRPNKDVKWPFTLTPGRGASAEEAVLRFTEEPEFDFAEYHKSYKLNKNGLLVRTKDTQFLNGKSLVDARTVRFAIATPLAFPQGSYFIRSYGEKEGELLKNCYASIENLSFQRALSSKLDAPVVELEWTPRGPEDVKKFIAIDERLGDIKLIGLSPVRQFYLSSFSQMHANALDLLKIRVTESSSSFGGEVVQVEKDGSRWVTVTRATLEAAVATKKPITFIAACAFRASGAVSDEVLSTVKVAIEKRRIEAKIARAKARAEKSAARKAKRKERHEAIVAKRAERRKRRSEERKARLLLKRAERAAKRAARRKLRKERRAARKAARKEKKKMEAIRRKEQLAKQAAAGTERKKAAAAKKALRLATKKAKQAAVLAERAKAAAALKKAPGTQASPSTARVAKKAKQTQGQKPNKAAALSAQLAQVQASLKQLTTKKAAALTTAGKKANAAQTLPISSKKAVTPGTSAKTKAEVKAAPTPVAHQVASDVAPTDVAHTVPTGTTVDL